MAAQGKPFGRLLRQFRAAAGLSQEALAVRSGISPDAISMLERGIRSTPRNSTVARLAAALRLEPAQRESLLAAAQPLVSRWRLLVPHELPRQDPDFIGRTAELATLARSLSRPVVISAINGMGGIGKSALAISLAHQVIDSFPDGQLYVNLHGATAGLSPLDPLDALGRMLRSLGEEPVTIPAIVDEAAARFRSLTFGRRLLVVLDNARDAEQVRPLLPGNPTCGVLITSRHALATLEGIRSQRLDVLSKEQALELLGRLAGPERVASDAAAAEQVIRLTGRLPLAIRIAGARLASRPLLPICELADELADATRRLEALEIREVTVRAAFDLSFAALDQPAADAFGLLSLPDGPDLGLAGAGRLIDRDEVTTRALLEQLVDAQLLESQRPGRYQFHDLMRLYARQKCRDHHSELARTEALTRLTSFYTATAWNTLALIRPQSGRLIGLDPRWTTGGVQFDSELAALDWLEIERANLLTAIGQAAVEVTHRALAELPSSLTSALNGMFEVRNYLQDWIQANVIALRVSERMNDEAGRATALNDLGHAYSRTGRYGEAVTCLRESLAISRVLGDRVGQAIRLSNLGDALLPLGKYGEAATILQESIDIGREAAVPGAVANSLINLALIQEELGRSRESISGLNESLVIARQLGDRQLECASLWNLGCSHASLGKNDEAIAYLEEGIAIAHELGSRRGLGLCWNHLGRIYLCLNRSDDAIDLHRRGLALAREVHDPDNQARALRDLGDALEVVGRSEEACQAWREGLTISEPLGLAVADQLRVRLGR